MMMSIITLAAPPVTSSTTAPTCPANGITDNLDAFCGQWHQTLLTDTDLVVGDENTSPGLLLHDLRLKRPSAIFNVQLEHKHWCWTTFFLHVYPTGSSHYLLPSKWFGKPDVNEQEGVHNVAVTYFENMIGNRARPFARNQRTYSDTASAEDVSGVMFDVFSDV